jgi:hypothetical protein
MARDSTLPARERAVVPGDLEHEAPGQVVLGEHLLGEVVTVAQRQVAGGDGAVGLGQAHLGVVEQ